MISGAVRRVIDRRGLRWWLAALLALPCLVSGESTKLSWNLDALLGSLAARQEGTARYTETRTMKVLTRPLRSSGLLRFRKPDVLEKRVLTPQTESIRVEGDQVTIEGTGGEAPRTLQLSGHPEVGVLIEAIRAPLTGSRDRLNQLFQVSLGGSERRWLLSLVPRDPRAAEWVRSVFVRGSGDRVTGVEIEERNGDRTVLRIEPIL